MITSFVRLPARRLLGCVLVALAVFAAPSAHAQDGGIAGFYRFPALSATHVWFTGEGDVWRVGLDGGTAERITTHPGYETHAAPSPDGRWLAFVAAYEGMPDVHVMPIGGGTPKRLSWFGTQVRVWGWTPAGEVLATGPAASGAPQLQLYALDAATGRQRTLPVGQASDGQVAADGRTLYFTRGGLLRNDNARAYRGGAMAQVWQLDLAGHAEARPLISGDANHKRPLPYTTPAGPRIAFLSDRDGRFNLWSVNARGEDLQQHTRHADADIRHASIHGSRVVYALGADVHLVDLAQPLPAGADGGRRLPVLLGGDLDHRRTRWLRRPQDYVSHIALAPNGERVALTVRGRIAVHGAARLRRAEAALPAEARCRDAQFSHDSRHVYALCAMSPDDEVEAWRLPADGMGAPLQITRGAKILRVQLLPSPDGRWLAHLDQDGQLWLTALAGPAAGTTHAVDGAQQLERDAQLVWSPDGQALAFLASTHPSIIDRLYLHRPGDGSQPGRTEVLTSDRYDTRSPAFTPDGRWLYFLSDREFRSSNRSPWGDRNMGPYFDHRTRVYALALQAGQRWPFQPPDELAAMASTAAASAPEAASAPASAPAAARRGDVKRQPAIQVDGLARRLHEVPLPAGNFEALRTDGKRLYLLEHDGTPERRRSLRTLAIDNSGAKPELYATEVRQLDVSPDGKTLLVVRSGGADGGPGDILLAEAGTKLPSDTARHTVRWADWPIAIEPLAEWRQMFADAWRLQRDHFYDAGLHGVDWRAVRRRHEPLVARVTDRAELNELFEQMVGELGLLHSQVGTRDLRGGADDIALAGLGGRFSKVAEGFRIDGVYRADPELPSAAPPLAALGVDAHIGEVITALDGRPTRDAPALPPLLRGLAGKQVLLTLRAQDGRERRAIVVPVDARREASLRYADWENSRAERTLAASGGRIGYLHLRAMSAEDIGSFAREFYTHVHRAGLVIDVRGNAGGNIDSWIIEKLLRRSWAWWQRRSPAGAPPHGNMQETFRGQLAVLVDGQTYSDGETFAAGIQALKLGTLIGQRTSGAGVWLSDRNRLADNGLMRAAESGQFTIGETGSTWLIEGRGVAPDIEVDNPPRATADGGDAQLDAAIAHLLQRIDRTPLPRPQAPAYPRGAPQPR